MVSLCGCGGKTPIQKYKNSIDQKDIKVQVKAIETLKEALSEEVDDENFIVGKQQALTDMEAKNKNLKKSLSKIKMKDTSVEALHNNMVQYTQNNESLISKTNELISLYQALLGTQDQKVIEETYGKIVQLARSIETLSQQTDDYRIAWEEALITMDVKTVQ